MKIDNNLRCKLESAFDGKIIRIMEGNSGRVFLVENNFTVPKFSAYKMCKKRSDHYTKLFLEEAEKWNSIYSRNIIPIYKIVEIDEVLYICMRDASSTLQDILLSSVDSITAYIITLQLLNGLMDMEDSGILYHQDFNPPNILIEDLGHRFNMHGTPLFLSENKEPFPPSSIHNSHKYRIMISDFAMSNYYVKDHEKGKRGGKYGYIAPEQYPMGPSGFSPDKFALGVIMCMLFSGKHPNGDGLSHVFKLSSDTSWELKNWTLHGERLVDVGNKIIKELILNLLSVQPSHRTNYKKCYKKVYVEFSKFDHLNAKIFSEYNEYFKGDYSIQTINRPKLLVKKI
jgi:hypothetical protein